MNKIKTLAAAVLAFGAAAAHADLTIDPTNAALVTHGAVGNDAPVGLGSTSLMAADNGTKTELYISATSLFGQAVTIGQIQSMSYWTKKDGAATSVDWTLLLYTAKTGAGDSGSWYRSRLNAEPYFVNSTTATAGAWNQWSTEGSEALKFFDQPRSGNYGTYNDPDWAAIVAGDVSWGNGVTHDYSDETISFFSLQTGSGWADFEGLVDGLTITLVDGTRAVVDFEATVPEPASLALVGLALAGAGFARRRAAKR